MIASKIRQFPAKFRVFGVFDSTPVYMVYRYRHHMYWGNAGPRLGRTFGRGIQCGRYGAATTNESNTDNVEAGILLRRQLQCSMPGMRFKAQVLLAEDVPTFLARVTAFLGDTVHDLLSSAGRAPTPAANHGADNGHVQWIHWLATTPLLSEPQRDPAGPVYGKTSDRASSAAAAARRVSSSSPLSARMTASRNSCAPIMRGTRTNPAPS